MKMKFVCLVFLLWLHKQANCASSDYYKAAVVNFQKYTNSTIPRDETRMVNVQNYENIMESLADQELDIIVFPESAFGDYDPFLVPDPKDRVVPDSSLYNPVLQNLSRAAKKTKTYLVVNVLELYSEDSTNLTYNTNVVFDRNGTVIARYRKYNLYGTLGLNRTAEPEHVYFDTDFGVRFGTFTCFDIQFAEPAVELVQKYNVTDFVVPMNWVSELPFLTAIQEQYYWSYANNVNLLASGLNDVESGAGGSGIFRGNSSPPVYVMGQNEGTTLVVGKVSKIRKLDSDIDTSDYIVANGTTSAPMFYMYNENLDNFTMERIEDVADFTSYEYVEYGVRKNATVDQVLCSYSEPSLCCNFKFNVSYYFSQNQTTPGPFDFVRFRLAAMTGERSYHSPGTTFQQICSIIPCQTRNSSSCGVPVYTGFNDPIIMEDSKLGSVYLQSVTFDDVTISGNFSKNVALLGPNILVPSNLTNIGELLSPSQFMFDVKDGKAELGFNPGRLIAGGINARILLNGSSSLQPKLFHYCLMYSVLIFSKLFIM